MPKLVDLTAFILLAAAVPCSMLLIAYHWWRHGRLSTCARLSPLWQPFLAVTLAQAVCYHSAIDPTLAAAQLLVWLGYLAVFYLARLAPRRWILAVLQGMGWLVAVVCLVELVVTGVRAGRWLQGNPNKVGGLLAVLIPLMGGHSDQDVCAQTSARRVRQPWDWIVHQTRVLVGVMGLVATGSRGAMAGVMASIVVYVLPGWKEKDAERLIVFVIVVFLAIIMTWGMVRPATIANRWENWREAVGLFIERPVTGWGPGCYTRLAVYEPGHPHADNWPLTVAAEMGLVGLAAWSWLAVAVTRLALRSPGRARLALVAFGVHNLVDATFWWWWIGIVVMVCLALLEECYSSSP